MTADEFLKKWEKYINYWVAVKCRAYGHRVEFADVQQAGVMGAIKALSLGAVSDSEVKREINRALNEITTWPIPKEARAMRIASGACPVCRQPANRGYVLCDTCQEKQRSANRKHQSKKRDRFIKSIMDLVAED